MNQVLSSSDPDVESSTDAYAARFEGEVGAFLLERQRRILRTILDKYPAGSLRILDVGGGHGQLTKTMLSYGHSVCVHGSKPECRQRLEKLSLLGERVEFIVRPFAELKSDLGSFDMVTAFRLMAHVPDWRTFLAQLAALSRKEIVIDFASLYSVNLLSKMFFPLKLSVEKNTRPFHCQRLSEVTEAFTSLGFTVTSVNKQFAMPLALHRAIGSSGFSQHLEQVCETTGLTSLIGSPIIISAERQR